MTLDLEFVRLAELLPLELKTGAGFQVDFGQIQGEVERYAGDYEVTPTATGKTLPTAEKRMEKDVTVHPIPYFCVSNPSGGDTVYIGGEIDMT